MIYMPLCNGQPFGSRKPTCESIDLVTQGRKNLQDAQLRNLKHLFQHIYTYDCKFFQVDIIRPPMILLGISTSLVAPTSSLKRDNPKGSASAGGAHLGMWRGVGILYLSRSFFLVESERCKASCYHNHTKRHWVDPLVPLPCAAHLRSQVHKHVLPTEHFCCSQDTWKFGSRPVATYKSHGHKITKVANPSFFTYLALFSKDITILCVGLTNLHGCHGWCQWDRWELF